MTLIEANVIGIPGIPWALLILINFWMTTLPVRLFHDQYIPMKLSDKATSVFLLTFINSAGTIT